MSVRRAALPFVLVSVAAALAARALLRRPPVSNPAVPQPAKPVDITAYAGRWYEIGRYENQFERGCEAVTADYGLGDGGLVRVTNACRVGGLAGRAKTARGRAKVVEGSGDAKLKVSFFGPLYFGDYWVLDHADDYAWSIVGEPSGRYLWLLSRTPDPAFAVREAMTARVREMGYDTDRIRPTLQGLA